MCLGAINLRRVNIKPNKAEKLLLQLNLPLALKAGTIGHLELKISLVSSLFSAGSQDLAVNLDEVFFIVGPSMRMTSKDDSYLEETEQELLQPYDQHNCFNIFSNNLKLRKKQKSLSSKASDSETRSKWTFNLKCFKNSNSYPLQRRSRKKQQSRTIKLCQKRTKIY